MAVRRGKRSATSTSSLSDSSGSKTKAAAKRKGRTKVVRGSGKSVVIDFPIKGEVVTGVHYAIRIGAPEEGQVEISINGQEWSPCRSSAGYWWYDWGFYTPGPYKIVARLCDTSGKVVSKSAATECKVE